MSCKFSTGDTVIVDPQFQGGTSPLLAVDCVVTMIDAIGDIWQCTIEAPDGSIHVLNEFELKLKNV